MNSGIGLHHGGIPRALQQYCIRLFNRKEIRILICTSTIIEGVNTVAKNVIVYDRRKSNNLLTYFTYKNIVGRAGRMGQYYIGSVFSLEKPLEPENTNVNIPIGYQDENTSTSMLLHVDKKDLNENSRIRVSDEIDNSILTESTLKNNFPYKIGFQNSLAKEISNNIHHYHKLLSWTTFPRKEQLDAISELIFDYLEKRALQLYNITSGSQLAYYLKGLAAAKGYSAFIKQRLVEEPEDPNQTLESALKIVRNVFCYSFPKALKALERIQSEIFQQNNLRPGEYGIYAEQVENLFLDPALFALDEYGVPIQTAIKLKSKLKANNKLDPVLDRLKKLRISSLDITTFEKEILTEIIPNL